MSSVTRADLHCHSSASARSRLGVQRSLGLPECVTDPDEVYELARRRGMDFVTVTDHDTIDGALTLMDRPGFFCSEELTASFHGEPQAVHVLCWGIDPDDHARLQERAGDVEACAAYLHAQGIACALAHPFHNVATPLTARHRRRLADMFGVWEVRNGSRAADLNMPAVTYAQTCGNAGVAGSDDHAGIDIGRTFTETPAAANVEEFLGHLRAGRTEPRGDQGGAAKWAHAAVALALRALGPDTGGVAPDPLKVMAMADRVVSQGVQRSGPDVHDMGPDDAHALLGAYLDAVGIAPTELIAHMQHEQFTHEGLERRARRAHERRLRDAAAGAAAAAGSGGSLGAAATELFAACVPAVPYVAAASLLARERASQAGPPDGPRRVAIVADGLGGVHGVTRVLQQVRERGVPGFEVELIGTDAGVDRRLPAVADIGVPFYEGLEMGVPDLPSLAGALADGRYDIVHLCSPGPAGVAAALIARLIGLPLIGSYHTELGAYAGLRTGDQRLRAGAGAALAVFYGACGAVLSPSESADRSLVQLGIARDRIARWDRGVDLTRFGPGRRNPHALPGRISVLYAGRIAQEKGVGLMADAFMDAHARDPRLHLVVAGGGPEEAQLRAGLGDRATFLGWLEGDRLAEAYASADLLCFPSTSDTFGQVVVEAQASGVAVMAAAAGGPLDLIEDGRSGVLVEPEAAAFADAIVRLAGSPAVRESLGRGALAAARTRTWDASMRRLGGGYARVLRSSSEAMHQEGARTVA